MFHVKQRDLEAARALAGSLRFSPSVLARKGISINQDGVARSALDLLAYPDIDWARLGSLWPELAGAAPEIAEQLSNEVRQKLQDGRPATLGQAARISGVTPAALVALLKHVRRRAA